MFLRKVRSAGICMIEGSGNIIYVNWNLGVSSGFKKKNAQNS